MVPFHFSAARLYKYDFKMSKGNDEAPSLTEDYDERYPLGTLVVSSPTYVGDVANVYPEISVGPATTPEDRAAESVWSAANGSGGPNRSERLESVTPSPLRWR